MSIIISDNCDPNPVVTLKLITMNEDDTTLPCHPEFMAAVKNLIALEPERKVSYRIQRKAGKIFEENLGKHPEKSWHIAADKAL